MKKRLIKAGFCLLTAVMLSIAGVGAFQQINETATVQAATADSIVLTVEDGKYRLSDNDTNPNLLTGYYDIKSDVKAEGVTVKKGIYYLENGYLSKKPRSVEEGAVKPSLSSKTGPKNVLEWKGYKETGTTITSGAVLFSGKYSKDGKIYVNGVLQTKVYVKDGGKMYIVSDGNMDTKKGYTGVFSGTYVDVASSSKKTETKIYYKSGSRATGVVNCYFYDKGKWASSYSGWKRFGKNRYYIKKGKALTGWQYLKSFAGGSKTYKYYFRKDGTLVTDLFSEGKNYNTYIKKDMTIEVNITTHTMTFYARDSKTKTYNTPLKAVVCSTSRKKGGTPVGNFRLEKTSAQRWFIYKKAKPYRYYQWAVHIKGTPSLIHSSAYYSKNAKNLNQSYYNGLGTNQTTYCVRVQAVNAKLIYDISTKTHKKKRVWVKIYRSSNKGAFGQVTLSDTTGKVSKSQKYDPTDPNYKK